jgi:hypothetical protein
MNRVLVVAALAFVAILSVLSADALATYHPTLGRWVSRDPAALEDKRQLNVELVLKARQGVSSEHYRPTENDLGALKAGIAYDDGPNVYQYVGTSPLKHLDPSGLALLRLCCFCTAVAGVPTPPASWCTPAAARRGSTVTLAGPGICAPQAWLGTVGFFCWRFTCTMFMKYQCVQPVPWLAPFWVAVGTGSLGWC